MTEADSDSIRKPAPVTLRLEEIHSLAARPMARGVTKLGDVSEPQRDLRLAASVIRALARSFSPSDVLTVENGNGA